MILTIIIILMLILGAYYGYQKGFVLQFGTLVSMFLGLIFAMYYNQNVAGWVTNILRQYADLQMSIPTRYFTNIVVFLFLFLLASGVFQGIWRWLNQLTRFPVVRFGNSLLGILAGLAVQYLTVFVVLNLLLMTQSSWLQQQYQQSSLAQSIVKVDANVSEK
ncbi:CvpA family protein [Ligilactobacillus pobuzihii]|uniref:Integral membrane protein n=1 Tax=Ligilactobacillus pobuzihii TaxID=449659 RepID=A0A0R2LB85_9LACO|nr:CvpA family protein [Ligilactobacillus pobuzihii]KRK08921.1 integral membrane protein [Ligilactobacillus pobuzihii E100301 = KCTC 13174]KRN99064.1 integral membrane protein [Ligilactobacillus pobuzihii]